MCASFGGVLAGRRPSVICEKENEEIAKLEDLPRSSTVSVVLLFLLGTGGVHVLDFAGLLSSRFAGNFVFTGGGGIIGLRTRSLYFNV